MLKRRERSRPEVYTGVSDAEPPPPGNRPADTPSDRPAADRTTADSTTSDRTTSDRTTSDPTTADRTAADRTTADRAPADRPERSAATSPERRSFLRVPSFSPLAAVIGWITAWGAIVIATASLERAGVPLGLNLGIADGGPGDNGVWAGIWLLIVSGGAFLIGGYAAARMARAHGTTHAALAWVVAMAATGADAIIDAARGGTTGVVRLLPGIPYWADTGLTGQVEMGLVLGIFAVASLLGALIGGALGQVANRVDRTDDAVVGSPRTHDYGQPATH